MTDWLSWAPLVAACCHIFEEFAWPGGFAEWYRRYRANGSSVTTRMLVIVNVLLLVACVNYALVADTRWGATALLGLCALLCSNGLWHAWASVKSHTFSPGVVTGILLYVPLMIVQFNVYLQARRVSLWGAAVAAGVGGSYHVWSAIYHKVGVRSLQKC
jgi:hypothetical protein